MGPAWRLPLSGCREFTEVIECHRGAPVPWNPQRRTMQDLLYIGLTIVVFAALWLLVKGVERFER
jgi:hypothetical protein